MEMLSMRVNEETKAALETVLNSFEGSRDEQLMALLEEVRHKRAASKYPGRIGDVTTFFKSVDDLRKMYEQSIEAAIRAREQVAEDYKQTIEYKDNEISKLKAENQTLKVALSNQQEMLQTLSALQKTVNENSDILKTQYFNNRGNGNSKRHGTYYPELFDL